MPPLVKTISDARHPSKGRYRFPRPLDRRPGLLSMMMDGRSIPKMLAEIRLHRRQDLWQDGRGGVIVQINAAHRLHAYFTLYL